LEVGKRLYGGDQIYHIGQLRVERVAISLLSSPEHRLVGEIIDLIEEDPADEVLFRTLTALFDHHLSVSAAARALHIHRNTLHYRLRRIAELTTYDYKAADGLVMLRLACLCRLYRQAKPPRH